MRMNTAASLSAVGMGLMLATIGCSRESKQTEPVSTEAGKAASTAPASGEVAKDQGQALVRVVNAAPNAPKIDVLAENAPVVSDVAFKTVTPYKEVPADASEFAVKPASQTAGEPIAKNSESIMSGRHYTLVVFPEQTEKRMGNDRNEPASAETAAANSVATLEVISDDLVQPSEGKARVRVINAAAGTDDIEVYLRGEKDPILSDVDFKEAVAYKEVDPIKTTLELRIGESMVSALNPKTGEPPVARDDRATRTGTAADRVDGAPVRTTGRVGAVLGTQAVNLEAGKSYTLVLTGRANGTSRHIDTLVVEDTIPPTSAATN
jgi:hypothetical protein